MKSVKELRRQIEGCELQHPAFMEIFNALKSRIEDARDGGTLIMTTSGLKLKNPPVAVSDTLQKTEEN